MLEYGKEGGENMKMPLAEQLKNIKQEYPEGYDYLSSEVQLPQYDENDDLITKEENKDESIH